MSQNATPDQSSYADLQLERDEAGGLHYRPDPLAMKLAKDLSHRVRTRVQDKLLEATLRASRESAKTRRVTKWL